MLILAPGVLAHDPQLDLTFFGNSDVYFTSVTWNLQLKKLPFVKASELLNSLHRTQSTSNTKKQIKQINLYFLTPLNFNHNATRRLRLFRQRRRNRPQHRPRCWQRGMSHSSPMSYLCLAPFRHPNQHGHPQDATRRYSNHVTTDIRPRRPCRQDSTGSRTRERRQSGGIACEWRW